MSWVLMLFLVGVVLLGAELFVPGGVLGVLGGVVMTVGCGVVFWEFGSGWGVVSVVAAVLLAGGAFLAELVLLPRTRAGRKFFLRSEIEGKSQGDVAEDGIVGKEGVAETALAPTGYVVVEGRRVEAFSQSGFVEKGERVCVVALDSFRVIVRKN